MSDNGSSSAVAAHRPPKMVSSAAVRQALNELDMSLIDVERVSCILYDIECIEDVKRREGAYCYLRSMLFDHACQVRKAFDAAWVAAGGSPG